MKFIILISKIAPTVNLNQNFMHYNFAIYEIKRFKHRSWEHQIHQRLFPMIKRRYKYFEPSQLQFDYDSFLIFHEKKQVKTRYSISNKVHWVSFVMKLMQKNFLYLLLFCHEQCILSNLRYSEGIVMIIYFW